MANNMSIDIIMSDPKFVELAKQIMEMEPDIDEDYLIPFTEDEEDEDGNKIVKTRKGDYGNDISYVPVKYIRERCDKAFNRKWSFFIVAERRETEPFDKWSKKDEEYVDGDNYLKCIGMMIVPGLGIKMEYGVKKVWGATEATDWKACKTDAFKKCCEAFGIYLDYNIEDEEDEDDNSSSKGGKSKSKLSLDDIDYTDDDLEEALETTVDFGKYDGSTLSEIYEDDPKYVEWLATKANDDDMRFFAGVIIKYNAEQEAEKSSHRKNKGKSSSSDRNSSRGNKNNKSSGRSKSSRSSRDDDEDDEKEELLDKISDALEEYDKIQTKSLIVSVTTSSKYPHGKRKLEELTLKELRDLADVLEV